MFRYKPQYVAKDKLGNGGFGEVYPYQRYQNDTQWVVKKSLVLHQDLPYAIAEIVNGFRCNHLNLLPVKGFYLEPHGIANPRSLKMWENFKEWKVVIKLPRMKDESLGGKIRRYRSNNQAFSEEEVLNLFYEIASGLKYLHEKKIAHRDLKPDNVLFNHEDIAVLSDFGFSTFTEDEASYTLGEDAMTKPYAAPEVYLGEKSRPQPKLKKRELYPADIWSFGVLIFEICSVLGGNNEGPGEERQKKFESDIEKLSYSSFLKGLLLKMLQSDPTQRIEINHLWQKLNEIIKGTSGTTGMVVEDEKNREQNNQEKGKMQVEESKGEVLKGHGECRDYEEDDRETSVLSVRDELKKDHGDLFEFEANATDQSLKIVSKKSAGTKEISEQTLGNMLEKLTTEVIDKDCRKFKELSLALPSGSGCFKIEGHSFAKLFGANQLDLEKLNVDLQGTSVNKDGLRELAIQISENLKTLQDLHLTFPSKTKGSGVKTLAEKVFSSARGLKRVELVLDQAKISKEELKEIGTHISKNLTDLERLTLDFKPATYSGSQLPEDGFGDLIVPIISGCQKLNHLDLDFSSSNLKSTGLTEPLPVEANSLQFLKLNFKACKQMRDKGATEIAIYVIPKLKNLKRLALNYSECKIADNGLCTLVEQISVNLPNLQRLFLAFAGNPETGGSMITGEGFLSIVDPIKSRLKKLELLHLDFKHTSSSVKEEKQEVDKAFSNVIKDFKLMI